MTNFFYFFFSTSQNQNLKIIVKNFFNLLHIYEFLCFFYSFSIRGVYMLVQVRFVSNQQLNLSNLVEKLPTVN